jgi:single-stranded-DNA-specific exonuclease
LWIDAVVAPGAIDLPLLDAIDRIGPFGAGHPDPVCAVQDARMSYGAPIKGDHVRCVFEGPNGAKVRAIAFRAGGRPLGDALCTKDAKLHLAVRLKRNAFGGTEKAEAEIVDASPA